MKTKNQNPLNRGSRCESAHSKLKRSGLTSAATWLVALAMFGLVQAARAQFDYTDNGDGTCTITKYTGSDNNVTIPDSTNGLTVTAIGDGAFVVENITNVTIPDSVTSIGNEAFYDTRLMDAAISANVTNIGSGAFAACSDLAAISVDAANPFYSSVNGILFDKNQDALVQYPGGLGLAGSYAVPAGVINISGEAFEGAGLTNVIMAGSVTNIGGYAFNSCSSLTAIYFLGNAPGADSTAFDGDSALTLYYLPGSTNWTSPFDGIPAVLYSSAAADFDYATNSDNATVTITGYIGNNNVVVIPDTINSLPVTGIGSGAFEYSSIISVTIPDSVTSIGSEALGVCYSLTSVTIPDSVTNIGVQAFENCYALANVTLGNGVTSIGQEAFLNCYGLTGVTLGTNVTSIGNGAFDNCTNLTGIIIPDSVTSIGTEAFIGCSLTSVTIPASVTSMGTPGYEGPFAGCRSLTNITVDAANSFYSSVGGVLFDKNQTTLIEYLDGLGGSYTIPANVTGIGDYAFSACRSLTSVTIPDSVTTIGDYAFLSCPSLTSVTIPDSVTTIGGDSFDSCASLTNVTIGDGVTSIEDFAFQDCPALASIYFQGNVPGLGSDVFDGDSSLTVYYLYGTTGWGSTFGGLTPQQVVHPEFYYTYNITNGVSIVNFSSGGNIVTNNVVIPATLFGPPVTGVGLPVTSIASGAFSDEFEITSVTIPDSVTNIGPQAFHLCTGLTNVSLGNGVISIGYEAFEVCSSLPTIHIPASVTSIGYGPFVLCASLTNITVDAANSFYSSVDGVLFDKNQDNLIEYPDGKSGSYYTISAGVTNIGDGAFYRCTNLTSIYFQGNAPALGSQIGEEFSSDPGLTLYYLPGTTGWTSFGYSAVLWNPQATAFSVSGGQYGFNIIGLTNATVVVEACTNLANPAWIPVSTNALPANGVSAFSDPQSGNYSSRYYRFSAP